MEEWRDIPGYESKYQVSNLGRIKSLINNKGKSYEKILKLNLKKHGYLQVGLYKNNKVKYFRVHRLVAQLFVENPFNYTEVNHKDENRTNNNFENLEWCTIKYNNNYGNRNINISRTNKKPIKCITTGKVFNSAKDASEFYKISRPHINSCCKGNRKSAGKYQGIKLVWKYIEEE